MNYIYSYLVCAFRANAIFYTVVSGPYTGVRVSMNYYLNIQDSKPCIYFLSIDYVWLYPRLLYLLLLLSETINRKTVCCTPSIEADQ